MNFRPTILKFFAAIFIGLVFSFNDIFSRCLKVGGCNEEFDAFMAFTLFSVLTYVIWSLAQKSVPKKYKFSKQWKDYIAILLCLIWFVIISLLFVDLIFISGPRVNMDLNERTSIALMKSLEIPGEKVTVHPNYKELGQAEVSSFGIGIKNEGERNAFRIEITLHSVFNEEGESITSQVDIKEVNSWLLFDTQPRYLGADEIVFEMLLMKVPRSATLGTYSFDVRVYSDDYQYGETKVITIVVKN